MADRQAENTLAKAQQAVIDAAVALRARVEKEDRRAMDFGRWNEAARFDDALAALAAHRESSPPSLDEAAEEWADWDDVTPPRPDAPDIDAVRKLAFKAANDFGFHETAIADPFHAENVHRKLGASIIAILGVPDGMKFWSLKNEGDQ